MSTHQAQVLLSSTEKRDVRTQGKGTRGHSSSSQHKQKTVLTTSSKQLKQHSRPLAWGLTGYYTEQRRFTVSSETTVAGSWRFTPTQALPKHEHQKHSLQKKKHASLFPLARPTVCPSTRPKNETNQPIPPPTLKKKKKGGRKRKKRRPQTKRAQKKKKGTRAAKYI